VLYQIPQHAVGILSKGKKTANGYLAYIVLP
jgi:hypothetical protein